MRGLLWLIVCLLASACWQPRYFVPRENLNGSGPDGDAAAVYTVSAVAAGEGEREAAGEVRLWSHGARARYTDDGTEVVDLHIGFEIENTGPSPLDLDVESVALEELFVDGYLKDPEPTVSQRGDGRAEPGTTARVDLVFRPPTTYPRDIDSFSVRFAVRDASGEVVSQVTPFIPRAVGGQAGQFGDPFWGPYGGAWGGFYGGYGGYGFWGGPWRGFGVRCW